jgi:hypothetical protein
MRRRVDGQDKPSQDAPGSERSSDRTGRPASPYTVKLTPQPQEATAFGFFTLND